MEPIDHTESNEIGWDFIHLFKDEVDSITKKLIEYASKRNINLGSTEMKGLRFITEETLNIHIGEKLLVLGMEQARETRKNRK